MSIKIGKYTAEGPFTYMQSLQLPKVFGRRVVDVAEAPRTDTHSLLDASGVYIILTRQKANSQWTVVDIGESGEVKTRVENHDREPCWESHNQGTLAVAVIYKPNQQQAGRKLIEQELRTQFNPLCGER